MSNKKKCVAFIPARSGSKRIENKNIKLLNGHPLIAYSIRAAQESKIFDDIICVTDSKQYQEIAKYYGANVTSELRPSKFSGSCSPDIEWVTWILDELKANSALPEIYSILRPTSPFRSAKTIIDAHNTFVNAVSADSLRAVEKTKYHPGKMWVLRNSRMMPLMPFEKDSVPWHSSQYENLPEIFIQNASLEFSYSKIALEKQSISGENIIPFISKGLDGFDINTQEDWALAKIYLNSNQASLPKLQCEPYDKNDLGKNNG